MANRILWYLSRNTGSTVRFARLAVTLSVVDLGWLFFFLTQLCFDRVSNPLLREIYTFAGLLLIPIVTAVLSPVAIVRGLRERNNEAVRLGATAMFITLLELAYVVWILRSGYTAAFFNPSM